MAKIVVVIVIVVVVGAGCTAAELLTEQADGLVIIDAFIRTESMETVPDGVIVRQLQQRLVTIAEQQEECHQIPDELQRESKINLYCFASSHALSPTH